jgi:hypothetical protein
MNARSAGIAVLASLLVPGLAGAQGLAGRFSIAVQGGTQAEVSGDLQKAGQGSLINRAVTLDPLRYRDVYGADVRWSGVLAYGVAERVEVFARGSYYESEAVGGVEAGAWGPSSLPVFAFFEPYEEIGVELGLRYYLAVQGRLKSYVAPVAGLRFADEVLVSYSVPDAGSALLNVPFSQKKTLPVFGLDLGFTVDLSDYVFLGIDSGIRWQKAQAGFDSLPGLESIDDASSRWTAPVSATLGVRF